MSEETIFAVALEKGSPEERVAYLRQACEGDSELRQRVEALLESHEGAGEFLQSPAADEYGITQIQEIAEGPNTVIGHYTLRQQIGEGGFGLVYMAEQTEPIRRRVALKIIKPGMDSAEVIARFEGERQSLAVMDHENIARVIDAGTTDSGRPYFVMDLIKGVPITEFCDDNHLTLRERLDLFIPVCAAVQHAHQKGIIHRDIKPSNVLVTVQNDRAVPKVIDFGVAKAISQRLTEKTLFTRQGQIIGTLEYMSPEQAEMSGLDIDTRSDIYSLGVLLYELLTGTTPVDSKKLRHAAFNEMQRMLREDEPPKPSTRISESGDALPSIAACRRTEPKRLGKLLRGDLDWVVMKALEKDRSRRYETAIGFVQDIQRYLGDEPVTAGPPSFGYKLSKLARKHSKLLLTGAAFVALLLLATGVSTWQAVRASLAEARAIKESQVTIALNKKLLDANQQTLQSQLDALLNAGPEKVSRLAEGFKLYQSDVCVALRKWLRRIDGNRNAEDRFRAACVLATLGEVDALVLDTILGNVGAVSDQEFRIVLGCFADSRDLVTEPLWQRVQSESDPQTKGRLAAIALDLGDPRPAQLVLATSPDPTSRITFIHGFSSWHGDLSCLPSLLREVLEPDFRSGICECLGLVPAHHVKPSDSKSLAALLEELYRIAPDGPTHSASEWAMGKLNIPSPCITPRSRPAAGVGWFVNHFDMTMIEVNRSPPSVFTMGEAESSKTDKLRRATLSRAYFVCNREVWEDLFVLYLRDSDRLQDEMSESWRGAIGRQADAFPDRTTGQRPVWQVSWFDAIEFCNWLSVKEGRQPCYQKTSDQWTCDFDASGYRLPTEAEWEYACRAMTETTWHFGNDESLLPKYAQCKKNALQKRQPGRKMQPNGFGLFDMYGNVAEWCWDWNGSLSDQPQIDPHGQLEGRAKVHRGGGTWNNALDECRSADRRSKPPSVRFTNLGFRVVCNADDSQNK